MHKHNHLMHSRVERVVIYKCRCGDKVAHLIRDFSPEVAAKYDRTIEEVRQDMYMWN